MFFELDVDDIHTAEIKAAYKADFEDGVTFMRVI